MRKIKTQIVVDGVELTVTQVGMNFSPSNTASVSVARVVGRDRRRKIDITSGLQFSLDEPAAITLVEKMKRVAAIQTSPCTCDYRYDYSDHAEHCQSIHVATYDGACVDDD